MDLHKPKPVHSFREFLAEITVVFVGILIALTMEHIVETLREHRNAEAARGAVKQEIGHALTLLQVRLSSQSCIDQRLKDLAQILTTAHEGVMSPQPSWISRPQYWTFSAGAWAATTASGRVALLNTQEMTTYGFYYQRLAALEREEEREQTAWAHLRGLESWTGPLGGSGKTGFIQALQEARYSSYRINSIASGLILAAQRDHIEPTEIKDLRYGKGICLPITDTREHAMSLSEGPTGDPE